MFGCDLEMGSDLFLTFSGIGDGGVYPWGVQLFLSFGR